jgi:hypothetical protein
MIDNPIQRRILRISENARIRFERQKRALHQNRALTDQQRFAGYIKAFDRYMDSWNRTRPLQREYELKYEVPMFRKMLARRRVQTAAK